MAVRRSRKEWSDVLARFETSGETMARFCSKRRISARTLTWWRWRLRNEQPEVAQHRDVRLIAVDVKQAAVPLRTGSEVANGPPAVFIRVADVDVRVDVGTDVAYVADLVGAIRSQC